MNIPPDLVDQLLENLARVTRLLEHVPEPREQERLDRQERRHDDLLKLEARSATALERIANALDRISTKA